MTEMLSFPVQGLTSGQAYKLISATVTPRPIAWVSSLQPSGQVNLAPFSSYTFISYTPPKVLISVGPGTEFLKDTLTNITARGEFCVSSATPEKIEPVVASAYQYPHGTSEVDEIGIDMQAAEMIETPFVAGSAIAMECRLDRILEVGDDDAHRLIIGTVICFHVDPAIWRGDRIDPTAYRPLGRIGGPLYLTRGDILHAPTPREPFTKR